MVKQVLKNQVIGLIGTFEEPRSQIKGWVERNGGTWVNNLDQRLQVLIASESAWYQDPQPEAIQRARSNNKRVVSLEWLKDKFYIEQLSDDEYSWEKMARTKQAASKMKSMESGGQPSKRKRIEMTAAEEYGDEVSEDGPDVSEEEEVNRSSSKKAKKASSTNASKAASSKKQGASMSSATKKGKLVSTSKLKAPTKVAKPMAAKGGKTKTAKFVRSKERAPAGSKREQEDRKKAEKAKKAMASINLTAEAVISNGVGGRYGSLDKDGPALSTPRGEKRVRFQSDEPEVFRHPPPKRLDPWEVDLPDGYEVALTGSGQKFWAFLVQTSTDNGQHFRLRMLVSTELPATYQVTLRYRGNAKGICQTLLEPIDSFETAREYFSQAYHWLVGKDWATDNDADEEDNVIHTGPQREDSPMQELTRQIIEFSLMPGMPSMDEIKQRRFKDKTGWKAGDGVATKATAVNTDKGKGKAPLVNTSNGKGQAAQAGRSNGSDEHSGKGKGKATLADDPQVETIDLDLDMSDGDDLN